MSFGNKIGINIDTKEELFTKDYGSIIVETTEKIPAILLGKTTNTPELVINEEVISIAEAIQSWSEKFNEIYPVKVSQSTQTVQTISYEPKKIQRLSASVKPKVFLPVFPGTNCEYDSARAFEKFGANTNISVFKNQNQQDIKESINHFARQIDDSQILMLSGGFSAGDEPDGSGKFITAVLMNEQIRESIENLLARDGLILGICTDFKL
jgi:phosphoribosylformylglycinamidine synthase